MPTDIKLKKTNILNALKTQVIRDCVIGQTQGSELKPP